MDPPTPQRECLFALGQEEEFGKIGRWRLEGMGPIWRGKDVHCQEDRTIPVNGPILEETRRSRSGAGRVLVLLPIDVYAYIDKLLAPSYPWMIRQSAVLFGFLGSQLTVQ
ncbi:hypothetical protein K435DRAFT_805769 [Dendrothele bispora CBS 962.96]|uniref:Uncharacterized protein n=1 Tax=Dendrothele bispora (strain CBS 962.96) TaxID=1314807 RepID=A0A4S8L9W9_DENBC|nr:hypothetical protein K435DRAFT_805769 [Dendrothele bispora CBS 962.96]